jgi:uncharacterized protein
MKLTTEVKIALKTSILSAVFTVVLLLLVNYFINHTWNLFGNQSKSQPFTVQGTGSATATPDESTISFTVTKTATKLQEAQNQANTFTNKIVSDLGKLGIAKKDIQTSNYNSYPNYNDNSGGVGIMQPETAMPIKPEQDSQTIISYTVSEDVAITVHNTNKANNVIDQITKDGAENVSGPDLTFSDAKQKTLENEARTRAIQDAKQKAQSMAEAAGIHLGQIINIQEANSNPYPVVRPLMMNALNGASKSAPTQINPGQNTVTSTITLSYETY